MKQMETSQQPPEMGLKCHTIRNNTGTRPAQYLCVLKDTLQTFLSQKRVDLSVVRLSAIDVTTLLVPSTKAQFNYKISICFDDRSRPIYSSAPQKKKEEPSAGLEPTTSTLLGWRTANYAMTAGSEKSAGFCDIYRYI